MVDILNVRDCAPILLALPLKGAPLSFDQLEEHSLRVSEMSFPTKSHVKAKNRRDSSGRLWTQFSLSKSKDEPPNSYSQVLDPVSGFRIILIDERKIAYRLPLQMTGEAKFAFLGPADPAEAHHNWKVEKSHLGVRQIEGEEFEGTLIVQAAEDNDAIRSTLEEWRSERLKLIGNLIWSNPDAEHRVGIENLSRGEPEQIHFQIPADYQIIDVPISTASPGESSAEA